MGAPLNGVATIQGRLYWFEVAERTLDRSASGERYLLFEMTPEEIADEQRRHDRVERVSGTHFCYHVPPEQRHRVPMPGAGVAGFIEWLKRLYPDDSPVPDHRRYEAREPNFEVTWEKGELSLHRLLLESRDRQ
jgi:hypothetical protein